MVDVFHTVFGIAGIPSFFSLFLNGCEAHHCLGLSLLGYPDLLDLDHVYCMPAATIERMGLRKDWQALERRTTPKS